MTVAINHKSTAHSIDPLRLLDHILARKYMAEVVCKRREQITKVPQILKPRMELCDDPSSQLVVALLELPGLRKEDITIDIKEGRIFVGGERRRTVRTTTFTATAAVKLEQDETRAKTAPPTVPIREADFPITSCSPHQSSIYPITEVKYGKFRRVIPLPIGTPLHLVRASLNEGMLEISWPRPPAVSEVLHVEVK